MLDFSHVPREGTADIQEFTTSSTATTAQWSTWRKPRGVTMTHILCIGGGAGGGSGFGAGANSVRHGGNGGGSSAQTAILVPSHLLPDILYVLVGAGGAGASSGAGSSGILSYVSLYPNTTVNNVLAVSGSVGPTGGGAGTNLSTGIGGTGGTIAIIDNMPLAAIGTYKSVAGQTAASGNAVFPSSGCCCMAGTAGGSASTIESNGTFITAIANTMVSANRPSSAAVRSNGSSGYNLRNMGGFFFAYPGMGAGSSNSVSGGSGGNGIHGSGGGGGGAGLVGGRGGNGGSGIVIFTSW